MTPSGGPVAHSSKHTTSNTSSRSIGSRRHRTEKDAEAITAIADLGSWLKSLGYRWEYLPPSHRKSILSSIEMRAQCGLLAEALQILAILKTNLQLEIQKDVPENLRELLSIDSAAQSPTPIAGVTLPGSGTTNARMDRADHAPASTGRFATNIPEMIAMAANEQQSELYDRITVDSSTSYETTPFLPGSTAAVVDGINAPAAERASKTTETNIQKSMMLQLANDLPQLSDTDILRVVYLLGQRKFPKDLLISEGVSAVLDARLQQMIFDLSPAAVVAVVRSLVRVRLQHTDLPQSMPLVLQHVAQFASAVDRRTFCTTLRAITQLGLSWSDLSDEQCRGFASGIARAATANTTMLAYLFQILLNFGVTCQDLHTYVPIVLRYTLYRFFNDFMTHDAMDSMECRNALLHIDSTTTAAVMDGGRNEGPTAGSASTAGSDDEPQVLDIRNSVSVVDKEDNVEGAMVMENESSSSSSSVAAATSTSTEMTSMMLLDTISRLSQLNASFALIGEKASRALLEAFHCERVTDTERLSHQKAVDSILGDAPDEFWRSFT